MIPRFPPFDYSDPQRLIGEFYASQPPLYQTIIKTIFAHTASANLQIFLVGGIVRDLFLGRTNFDFDFVCLGDARRFARQLLPILQAIPEVKSASILEHDAFATARLDLEFSALEATFEPQGEHGSTSLHIDFATARRETYTEPAALPTVEINPPASLEEDLRRRDFTINAMAMSPQNGLVDPFNGLNDLRDGWIRVLHVKSFENDPTRMVRGVRFATRFGYKFEPETEQLLQNALKNGFFNRLSAERKRNELRLILREIAPDRALAMLQQYGLLEVIHPLLVWGAGQARDLQALKEAFGSVTVAQALAALTAELGTAQTEQIINKLRFAGDEAEIPLQVARLIAEMSDLVIKLSAPFNSNLYKMLKPYQPDALRCFAVLRPRNAHLVQKYLDKLIFIRPKLGGDYLRTLGLKPGPLYRPILEALHDAVLDGELKTEAEEAKFLQNYINKLPKS